MHGRLKVRTSEEEKIKKEKERKEKLKVFKHAMLLIENKRQKCELDTELLDMTGQVLTKNPDINTLWNIRREILIDFRSKRPEEITQLYDAELSLTEYCLKINPKSYCAWHHREWVLTTRSDPDWKKELSLCNTYLKLDERNFHTWDYRRFVVSQCKPDLIEEFNYTTEKLYDNFSNYSAWHYRSKMLLQLFPDKEGGRPIQDVHFNKELKMVLSAAFTDPDDTSAWFYQRWLLGAVKNITQVVVCTVAPSKMSIAFNNNVSLSYIKENIKLTINNADVVGEWKSCLGYDHDVLWVLKHDQSLDTDVDIKVEHILSNTETEVIALCLFKPSYYVGRNKISFQNNYSCAVLDELNDQLDACRQLLELEPDNKWTLLTTAFFLHCVDAKTYHSQIMNILATLIDIDKQRSGYYNDLRSKWSMEDNICKNYANLTIDYKVESKLTCLPHLQYYSFCEIIDLSDNNLTSRVLPGLIKLQHCKKLNLSNNKLTSLLGFPYLTLEELIIKDNPLLENDVDQLRKKLENTKILF